MPKKSQSANSSNIECYYCHRKGHIASRYPRRTLTIELDYAETIPTENTLKDFNPLEPTNSEEEYEEEYEELGG